VFELCNLSMKAEVIEISHSHALSISVPENYPTFEQSLGSILGAWRRVTHVISLARFALTEVSYRKFTSFGSISNMATQFTVFKSCVVKVNQADLMMLLNLRVDRLPRLQLQ
jgi:hypothetical protein